MNFFSSGRICFQLIHVPEIAREHVTRMCQCSVKEGRYELTKEYCVLKSLMVYSSRMWCWAKESGWYRRASAVIGLRL